MNASHERNKDGLDLTVGLCQVGGFLVEAVGHGVRAHRRRPQTAHLVGTLGKETLPTGTVSRQFDRLATPFHGLAHPDPH